MAYTKVQKDQRIKINASQRKEIVKLLLEGYTQQSIANEFGVSRELIAKIKREDVKK